MATHIKVEILNWFPPGEPWWTHVAEHPDENLIQVRATMKMSYLEYQEFLRQYDHQP